MAFGIVHLVIRPLASSLLQCSYASTSNVYVFGVLPHDHAAMHAYVACSLFAAAEYVDRGRCTANTGDSPAIARAL